jgi:glycosyltransferase involved in cell wall biosynthesis
VLLARDRIDVCLVYGWPEAITAARTAGVRAIVESVDGGLLATRVQDKAALTRVICESRHVRGLLLAQRTLLGLDPSRVEVIPNGVDLERFDPRRVDRAAARATLGLPADAFIVGSLARLAPVKNLAQLVDGFAVFAKKNRRAAGHARLVLAGPDGGERAALEERAADLGIGDRVLVPGMVANAAEALRAFDVFALTSWFEGRPYALLEAMAMGLPIVATPVGAVPELLDDNAIIVELMAPLPTARALATLSADPGLRERLGRRSRVLARRSSMDRMVGRWERMLEAVLDDSQVA